MSHVAASDASTLSASRWPIWTGRTLSSLVVVFLVMDASMKIAALSIVTESAPTVGWTGDPGFWRAMGLLLLAITALYAWPRTAVLGAILLTGYLGGAIATHVRLGNPLFSHVLFPIYVALPLWAGLYLREERLRALIPVRK
jgi:DoxX-like family